MHEPPELLGRERHPRVSVGRPEREGVGEPVERKVVDVLRLAADESWVFETLDLVADESRGG